jgi:hypothetical protein
MRPLSGRGGAPTYKQLSRLKGYNGIKSCSGCKHILRAFDKTPQEQTVKFGELFGELSRPLQIFIYLNIRPYHVNI